jgi:hypothetical protein
VTGEVMHQRFFDNGPKLTLEKLEGFFDNGPKLTLEKLEGFFEKRPLDGRAVSCDIFHLIIDLKIH